MTEADAASPISTESAGPPQKLPEVTRANAPERLFVAYCVLLGLGLFGLCEWVLPTQFFRSDDLVFLGEVQHPDWSWTRVFFPVETFSYWNVRPLGVDTYFRLCTSAFGVDPAGFFQVNVLVHFAVGPVAYRIARQLGLAPFAAGAAAVLCISRPPSMFLLFYGAGFASIAAQLFVALSVTFHLDFIRTAREMPRVASVAALLLGMLSHEIGYFAPVVLVAASLCMRPRRAPVAQLVRALRDVVPALCVALPYLALRFTLFAPLRDDSGYQRIWGARHVLRHLAVQLQHLAEAPWAVVALVGACAVIAALSFAQVDARRRLQRELIPAAAFCTIWTLAFLAPIVLLPHPHVRFSHYVEVPVALFVATFLQLAYTSAGPRSRTPLLVCLALGLAFAVPWSSVAARRAAGEQSPMRRLVELIDDRYDEVPLNARFVLLYGVEPLAPDRARSGLTGVTTSGTMLVQALYFDRNPALLFHDVRTPPAARLVCDECIYIELLADASLRFRGVEPPAGSVFARALTSSERTVQMAGARQLARRFGMEALPVLRSACEDHDDATACWNRITMAVARSEGEDDAPLLRALRTRR